MLNYATQENEFCCTILCLPFGMEDSQDTPPSADANKDALCIEHDCQIKGSFYSGCDWSSDLRKTVEMGGAWSMCLLISEP